MLNWLLVFVPITVALEFLMPDSHSMIFIAACLAIVPLAGWLGRATEQLSTHTGEGVGGLLNATFGNAAELIIAVMALRKGLYPVVKASLTGSIIGNILLVLGAAVLAGGIKHKEQRFNETAARAQSTLLTLAAIALIMPAAFHYLAGPGARVRENDLSLEISIVLLFAYGAVLGRGCRRGRRSRERLEYAKLHSHAGGSDGSHRLDQRDPGGFGGAGSPRFWHE